MHKYFVRKVRAIIENLAFYNCKMEFMANNFYRNVIEGCGLFNLIHHQKILQIYKHKYFGVKLEP